MKNSLVLLCLLSLAASANTHRLTPDKKDLPSHVTPLPARGEEALLFWGQTREERIADGAAIRIAHIRQAGPDAKEIERNAWIVEVDYSKATSAVLAAGTYDVRATCQTGRGFEFRNQQLTVVAGKRYLARCLGRTRRTVRLQIDEL